MVFTGEIDPQTKAFVKFLQEERPCHCERNLKEMQNFACSGVSMFKAREEK